MKNDLISVVVPVYNVEKYLDECIESIVNQTYSNLDIVLVDDGSVDNSSKICDDWAKKDKRIIVIHKKNAGVCKAVIDGIKKAKGEFVCFSDSDDYLEKNFVEVLLENLKQDDADICIANYSVDDGGKIEFVDTIDKRYSFCAGENIKNCAELFHNEYCHKIFPSRCMKIFRKELLLNSINYLDVNLSMAEDVNMLFYCLCNAKRVTLIPDNVYYYRTVGGSLSHKLRNSWKNYSGALNKLLEINDEFNYGLEQVIFKAFGVAWIMKGLQYGFVNKDKEYVKSIFENKDVQRLIENLDANTLKYKLVKFALKHKKYCLLKLMIKLKFGR